MSNADLAHELETTPPQPEQPSGGGLIGWWARNGVAANLLMVLAVIAGAVGFSRMDRLVFPSVDIGAVSITTSWPGASPADVEEQILTRIEESVADLEGIDRITSTANEAQGLVVIEANRSVDLTRFVNDVKLRIDAINNLPADSFRPVVARQLQNNWFIGLAIYGDVEPLVLKRIADNMRDDIAVEVPSGSRAEVTAVLNEEVAIEVSEQALRRYGLTFDEVARAVANTSVNASAGRVRTPTGSVTLNTRNLADTEQDFADIVIRQTADGADIRVGDVAQVIDGFEDFELTTSYNGLPMVMIGLVTLENNMDVVAARKGLDAYLETLNLPEGVNIAVWFDESSAFAERMDLITNSAALGLFLVFIVLILFLRPTVAVWVTIGIAVTFAGTFAILQPLGVSLNMLSTFAFLLVIGVVVDDAIIVGESIHNQVERGQSGAGAAILGARLVAKPVVFAVITTMMAFAPWMLLSGPEVTFTRQISLVVIAALTFSLIESLLILPNHLAHMKPQRTDGFFGPLIRFQRRLAEGLLFVARNIYKPVAELAVRWRYVTITIFFCMFAIAVAVVSFGYLKFSFLPDVESDYLQINITLQDGVPFSRTTQVKAQLEAARDRYAARMNTRDDGLQIIQDMGVFAFGDEVEAYLTMVSPEDRPRGLSLQQISDELRAELGPIPDAEEIIIDYTFNQREGGVRYVLQSKNEDALAAAAGELKLQLDSYQAVVDVRDTLQAAADEARLSLLPNAETLGLTLNDVTRQVRQAFYGEEVQRLPRNGEDVLVIIRATQEERRSLDTLNEVRIRTQDGREVPLGAVARIDFAPGVNRIERRDRQRAVYVIADVSDQDASDIEADLDMNFFPAFDRRYIDVDRSKVGDREQEAEFLAEVVVLLGMMLVAMYMLLAMAFRAVFQPLLVMTAIPFSLVGAVAGHLMMDLPLALFSFFGMGAAAGVVINDNLVLIDYVNRLRREHKLGAFQALIEAGVARFRPILLTSVTTFIGVLPMMMERSTQAQFLKPMVVSLGFAVVFALFLTLFLVPALYAVGTDVRRYFHWAFRGGVLAFIGARYDRDAPLSGDLAPPPDAGGDLARPRPAE